MINKKSGLSNHKNFSKNYSNQDCENPKTNNQSKSLYQWQFDVYLKIGYLCNSVQQDVKKAFNFKPK